MGIKAKLGMAVVASATGTAMIAGGAFAMFTAQTSNGGNTFTAGTLTIEDYSGGPIASQAVYFNNLAPGDSGTLKMTVKNTGSLDAWVKIDQLLTKQSETGDLFGGSTPLALNLTAQQPVTVAAGQTVQLQIPWSFPLVADNFYQAKHGNFTVYVDAVQQRNNGTGDFADAVVTSINVDGPGTIVKPHDGQSATYQYTATVYDQSHNAMNGQAVTWTLNGAPNGVSIDSNGLVTVQNMDYRGFSTEFDVIATIPPVSGHQQVQVVKHIFLN